MIRTVQRYREQYCEKWTYHWSISRLAIWRRHHLGLPLHRHHLLVPTLHYLHRLHCWCFRMAVVLNENRSQWAIYCQTTWIWRLENKHKMENFENMVDSESNHTDIGTNQKCDSIQSQSQLFFWWQSEISFFVDFKRWGLNIFQEQSKATCSQKDNIYLHDIITIAIS